MIALTLALMMAGSTASLPNRVDASRPAISSETVAFNTQPTAPDGPIQVRLRCTAFGDGHIGGCTVLEETRPGLGFGRAAIALMEMSGVEPDRHDDKAVDVTFEHTIDFAR